jgi:mRNA interferase MazF
MRKVRPALVLSSDALGRLPIKLVAPITEWKQSFERHIWHVPIEPDETNGLTKKSAVDALQLRSLDISRFQQRIGRIPADLMEEVALSVGLVVEMP